LDEDGYVFDHGTQGANQPGEVDEQVLFLLGVEEDLRMLAKISTISIFKKGLTPAPYVALPKRLRIKKSSDKPSQDFSRWFLMIWGIRAPR
jgi:hypothetical protein